VTFDRAGVFLRCHTDPFSFWLWNNKDTLRDDELFLEHFLREGDTVIDAGANIGLLTLRAAKCVGASGLVYSIEPHPETYAWLQKNIACNSWQTIHTYNVALGDRVGTVPFTNFKIKDVNKVSQEEGTLLVPMQTIDTLFSSVTRCMLLKIDVEGYELPALFGAEEVLKKVDVVMFESSPQNFARQGYELQHIIKFFESIGFGVYLVLSDMTIQPLPLGYETKVKYENLYATRDINFFSKRLGR
jgi:FkbM family methyltransferase